jgi:1,2-diacylglycerol 3-beta-galactosyltransferase
MTDPKRVLLLFSDTGGGHRSAAEAIIEALETYFPGRVQPDLVDVFKDYAPRPLDHLPEAYPSMVRVPKAWGLGYKLFDGHLRGRALTAAFWPYVRSAARRVVSEHPADMIVSVHPLLTWPVIKALPSKRPPFMVVVTDLVSAHALWYNAEVDTYVVATAKARAKALEMGLSEARISVLGLPVAERFCRPSEDDPMEARRRLGWPLDRPMVLMVGGGEGMGPLFDTARAIARQPERFGLAVVAGRNERLRSKLDKVEWEIPTFIYGFVSDMPEMMQAANVLVTKAGPGTITEALNAGLPMVLYSRLPGQEEGNVDYVVDKGVGIWAPGPEPAAAAVARWLRRPEDIERASAVCREIARPAAAKHIAELIVGNLDSPGGAPRQGISPSSARA